MPGEDGYALVEKVRRLRAASGGNIPAIALTAYARTEDRGRSLLVGFDYHITKPVEPFELLAVIAALAARPSGGAELLRITWVDPAASTSSVERVRTSP